MASAPDERAIVVRRVRRTDFTAIIELQRRARPLFRLWTPDQLECQLSRYPMGQLVATRGKLVVGACASLKLRLGPSAYPVSWEIATGRGEFGTHRPDGDVLYVASMAIAPDAWRASVRRVLDDALLTLALVERVPRVLLPVRLSAPSPPDGGASSEELVADRLASDPVVRGLVALGFRALGALPDGEGGRRPPDHLAALLEWREGPTCHLPPG